MRTSRIKTKLRNNEPVLLTTLHFFDPSVFEMTSLMGFDGIWIDLEHHPTSLETAATLVRAARVGSSDVMLRPAKGEFMRMGRMLEVGAQGIMYPRCDNADEAKEVVKWSKFAPMGQRGIDSGNGDNPYCMTPLAEYIEAANEQTFVVIQLEDPHAVSQAEAIGGVDGVDVLFFGPGDFSIITGHPGEWDHPVILEAMQTVADAAKKTGKHWGMPTFSTEHAQKLLDLGATFLCHGADLLMVRRGFEAVQTNFAPLGFTFDKRG